MSGPRRPRLGRALLWPAVTGALVIVLVAAGAAAAIETDTVTSYWHGLWWSISLSGPAVSAEHVTRMA